MSRAAGKLAYMFKLFCLTLTLVDLFCDYCTHNLNPFSVDWNDLKNRKQRGVRSEKKEMEACEVEWQHRTEGGRKEVGLARALKRGGTSEESPVGARDGKKWEGETGWGIETDLRDFCFCGSVELFVLWKNVLFLSVNLLTFLSFDAHFCHSLHHLPVLYLPLFVCLSPCFNLFFFHHSVLFSTLLSMASTLCSSPCLLQPLFSQDASLQGVLHQNGTETERGRELGIMLSAVFSESVFTVDEHFQLLMWCRWKWQTAAGCIYSMIKYDAWLATDNCSCC